MWFPMMDLPFIWVFTVVRLATVARNNDECCLLGLQWEEELAEVEKVS